MALTVEDGSIVAGADSYISLATADAYWTEHGSPTSWTDATDAEKEAALRYATQWVDGKFSWKGNVKDNEQVLDWPRYNVYDDEGRLVSADSIPEKVQEATAEMANNHIDAAVNVALARGGATTRETVGPITVEYLDWANPETDYPYVKRLLQPYAGSGGVGHLTVTRVA